MKTKTPFIALMAVVVIALSACITHPDYVSDFRFPITDGDLNRGEQTFVALQCTQCHVISEYELPAFDGEMPIEVELGGTLLYAKTYADLVTSIINPNYRLSERYLEQFPGSNGRSINMSPMHRNDDMTVAQLIDIVTFLNSRYILAPGYREEFLW